MSENKMKGEGMVRNTLARAVPIRTLKFRSEKCKIILIMTHTVTRYHLLLVRNRFFFFFSSVLAYFLMRGEFGQCNWHRSSRCVFRICLHQSSAWSGTGIFGPVMLELKCLVSVKMSVKNIYSLQFWYSFDSWCISRRDRFGLQ